MAKLVIVRSVSDERLDSICSQVPCTLIEGGDLVICYQMWSEYLEHHDTDGMTVDIVDV